VRLNGVIDSAAEPRPAASRLRELAAAPAAAPVLLTGLLVAAFTARVLLARYVLAPWEMPDEMLYGEVSRSFNATGQYLFREHELDLRTIYPALISPAWFANSSATAYPLIKAINVTLMTLGAIPLYLWARRLVTPLWALLPVVLYLAMPGFIYTAEILTENAFVPAAVLALFAIASALERPALLRQFLALGAIVLAAAVRLQGLVFLLILPTALLLALLLDAIAAAPGDRRRTVIAKLRRFLPTVGVLAVGLFAYLALRLARGGTISSGLGTYQQLTSLNYQFRPALRWIAFHFGELSFSVGLLPVAALVLLLGLACRRATTPAPAERAFLAAATAGLFWIVVQVGVFASSFSVRIEERYMFSLAPVLFLALTIWLARGLPRPTGLTAVAVLVPVAFLLALPFEAFFTGAIFNDTYGLLPLWRLSTRLAGGTAETRTLVGLGALAAGILFAALPRNWSRIAVPAAVGGFLLLSSASVFAQVEYLSAAARHAGGLGSNPTWVDDTVGRNARVEVLYTAEITDPHVVWQAEFWNRSVRRLFGVSGQDPSIPDLSATFDPATGRLMPGLPDTAPDQHPRYVLAARTVDVAGERLAQNGFLSLYRVRPPLRLAGASSGIFPDRWTGPTATYTRYVVPPGTDRVDVLVERHGITGPPPAKVRVAIGPVGSSTVWKTEAGTVRNGGGQRFTLPVRRAPFQVRLSNSPTFSPSQFGSPDTRQLGVRVSFIVR
jgi:hypothetical protein